MTVDEFANQLSQFGEQYVLSETNSFWEQAIEKVQYDLRQMNLTTKPTANINYQVDGDDVALVIEPYLLFQNYGVTGIDNRTRQFGVPTEVGINPQGSGRTFQFGLNPSGKNYWGIHYPGIEGKHSFDIKGGNYNITENFLRYFSAIQQQQSNL